MDYGIKICKPGVDVDTAGLKDQIFNSEYPVLKIKETGTGSINWTPDGGSVEETVYTHGLGYKPVFYFFTQWYSTDAGDKETSYRHAPYIDDTYWDLGIWFSAEPYVTTTTLQYKIDGWDNNSTTYTLNYFYAVYYDPEAG